MPFCLASGAAFGSMAVFGKLAYDEGATAGTLLVTRFVLAALLFWVLAWVAGAIRVTRADARVALGLGALGYALQAGCYFTALERIDVSLLSLLLYTFPAMVACVAACTGRDALDRRRATALVVSTAGLALVVGGAGPLDALGAVLALAAAVVYTAYVLTSHGVAARTHPLVLSALVCTGAATTLVIVCAALGELRPGAVSAVGWGWLACLSAISTVAAIGLFFAGLRRVGPTTAAILATVEPVVAVLLAFAVLGETLAAAQLLGGSFVLAAVVALARRPTQRRFTCG